MVNIGDLNSEIWLFVDVSLILVFKKFVKTCCELVKRAAKQLKERIERSLRDTLMNLRKTMNQRTTMDFGGNTVLRKLLPNLEATKGRDIYIAKNQKLCRNQNSKWRNFAIAFILNLVRLHFNHIIQFSTPIYSWLSK